MKKAIPLIAAGLILYSCATVSKDDFQPPIQAESQELVLEERLDTTNPDDVAKLIVPDRKYAWDGAEHVENSVSWYNPSLKTLDTGLRLGDLVVVLYPTEENNTPIIADEARVKFYSDMRTEGFFSLAFGHVTIEYKIGDRWFETSPRDPEGNINLLDGELGGIYRTVDDLILWPESGFEAMGFDPYK